MVRLQYSVMLLLLAFCWQAKADFPTAKALFEQQEYALAKPQLETLAELAARAEALAARVEEGA